MPVLADHLDHTGSVSYFTAFSLSSTTLIIVTARNAAPLASVVGAGGCHLLVALCSPGMTDVE
jgi:hypothetical protein